MPSSLGSPPYPTDMSLGSFSTSLTPVTIASNGSAPPRSSVMDCSMAGRPLRELMIVGRRPAGWEAVVMVVSHGTDAAEAARKSLRFSVSMVFPDTTLSLPSIHIPLVMLAKLFP